MEGGGGGRQVRQRRERSVCALHFLLLYVNTTNMRKRMQKKGPICLCSTHRAFGIGIERSQKGSKQTERCLHCLHVTVD